MSKRQRHSDGSSQSEDRRERRNTSSTKEGYGQSGATPSRCQPFTPQGPGLIINGPLPCGPSTQGFGPPGCFSSKPKGPGLLGAGSLRREQVITRGPCLLGADPRGYEPLRPKGPGLLGNGPPGYEPSTPKGPVLLGNGPLGYETSTRKGPGLLGTGPDGYEPLRPKGPGLLGAGPHGYEPSTPKGPVLLGNGPLGYESSTRKGPGLLGTGPDGYEPLRPKVPGLLGAGPLEYEPSTPNGPGLLGAGPRGCEPSTTTSHDSTHLLGDCPIGHEPFTNYSSRLPSFSPVPVQKLNNNMAQNVSSEFEFRNMDIDPGLKEESHWQSQIRELKQYVVKLENDKCQMSEQIKKMNNYIVKVQSENSRLIAINESNNNIKNAIAGQIFKQHPRQFGERELNFVVEKVYAKLKSQNLSPFGVIESTSMSNSYAPHSNQNQVSAGSEINVFGNKKANNEDDEIQIIEPVKKESYDPYDHLDLDDVLVLLKTFKELEKSEQENLLAYIKKLEKKFPEKARILKAKYSGVM